MIPHQIMTPEQTAEFLSERRQAVIGIDRKHGPPILSTVWYRFDHERFFVAILKESTKYKLLCRSPEVSVLVDGQYDDMRNLVAYGHVSFLPAQETKPHYFWIMERYFDDRAAAELFSSSSFLWGNWVIAVIKADKYLAKDFSGEVS